jgi:hypothetical protein
MKKLFVIILLFFPLINILYAQTGMHLIPRQIFVGDPAALVLNLPAAEQESPDIILTSNLPSHENIDFHRIILERRITGSRLIIEFSAFDTGILEFPVIEIGGEYFSNLSVTVNSVLNNRSDRMLSGTTSTLAIPGTALMLYGTIAALVFFILLTIWFFVKGRIILRKLHEKWKRKRLFAAMRKTEKRLRKAITKGTNKRKILDKLSDETRNFLSVLTGNNCRAMTAREFEFLPVQLSVLEKNTFPGKFFRVCDELRFSGVEAGMQDILRLLDDLKLFVSELEKPKEKEKQTEVKAA